MKHLFALFISTTAVLISACDPSQIDPDDASQQSGGSSSSGQRLGFYERVDIGNSELARLSDAWIEITDGDAGGDGSLDSPIALSGQREFSFQTRTEIFDNLTSYNTRTVLILQDISSDNRAAMIEFNCQGNDCAQQSVSCMFDPVEIYSCNKTVDHINKLTHFSLSDIESALGELPVKVRLDIAHCVDAATICDLSTVGYAVLGE